VIGARFVLADGTVGHSGGKVVKNVAGYDVAKLLIGSLGTLAVITQLSLRLHPAPQASHTLVVEGLDAAGAEAAWQALERTPVVPAKVLLLWPQGTLLVQIDGTEGGVEAQAAALATALAPLRPRAIDAIEEQAAWPNATPVAALAVPRTRLASLLECLAAVAEHAVVLPSLGVAEAHLPATTTPEQVAALRTWAEQLGGHLVLRRPTAALAQSTWPARDDPAVDLMRAVKRSLDPTATLAPGRFFGGI
jgi:glycolate oxidase FAD binding subunit